MNPVFAAAPTGDQSGSLQEIGADPGVLASCFLGASGPNLYFNFGKGIAELTAGAPDIGLASWILTMLPGVELGPVALSIGYTLAAGYSNTPVWPKFKIRDFGPGFSANPVQIEIYLTDVAGDPLNPGTALGSTGYLSFVMSEGAVRAGSCPAAPP